MNFTNFIFKNENLFKKNDSEITNKLNSDFYENNLKISLKQSLKFPYEIKFINKALNSQLLKDFKGEKTGFVQIYPDKWLFPSKYFEDAKHYYNLEVRKSDTWIVTYPRSGTTLTQELIWLVANNFDFETAKKFELSERFPFLEFSSFIHDETKKEFLLDNSNSKNDMKYIENMSESGWKAVSKLQSPRFIKTHFPFSLLPKTLLKSGCKVIYVARNPKDVVVSFYYLNRSIKTQGYCGNFENFVNYFINDLIPWTPYWKHIKEGWERRDDPNVLFLFYEDIINDMRTNIKKISEFLNRKIKENEIDQLIEHLKIENFRENESVNMSKLKKLNILLEKEQGFVRSGKINGWKEEFNVELNKKFDNWVVENIKEFPTNFKFPLK